MRFDWNTTKNHGVDVHYIWVILEDRINAYLLHCMFRKFDVVSIETVEKNITDLDKIIVLSRHDKIQFRNELSIRKEVGHTEDL